MSATETDLPEPAEIDDLTAIVVNDYRLDLLDELRAHRQELYRKSAGSGRIRDEKKEEIRTGKSNAYNRAVNAELRLLDAIEDAQTSKRLEVVEEELGIERDHE